MDEQIETLPVKAEKEVRASLTGATIVMLLVLFAVSCVANFVLTKKAISNYATDTKYQQFLADGYRGILVEVLNGVSPTGTVRRYLIGRIQGVELQGSDIRNGLPPRTLPEFVDSTDAALQTPIIPDVVKPAPGAIKDTSKK